MKITTKLGNRTWLQLKNLLALSAGVLLLCLLAANGRAQVFTTLHTFTGGSDGSGPIGGVILSGNTLYGTAQTGGGSGYGTVFALNTDGTGFRLLERFNGAYDAAYPNLLVLSGNTLYGGCGGTGTSGTLFAVSTNGNGTGFTNLHVFTTFSAPHYTNSDGGEVWGPLILSGNTLYGTASAGGSWGWGTVFAVSTNGTGFTNLYSFTGGSDGAYTGAGLVLSGNTLYGSATWGGTNRSGTVFALNTDGTGFTVLHVFTATNIPYVWPPPSKTNIDGAWPVGFLILSGNTLYGATFDGGIYGKGTVFAVNTDGTGFTTLYNFTGGQDGANPQGGLILSGNTLYGTARYGTTYNDGTVFSLSYPSPQLTIMPSGTNVNLTWPSGVAGFSYSGYTLQSSTNLGSSAVWTTNSPAPVVFNGQCKVTNPITGSQMFFRLSQ